MPLTGFINFRPVQHAIFGVCLLLCLAAGLSAQTARAHFQDLLDENEKPLMDLVSEMAQDADGFLWTGGKNGLTRFDGNHYKRYSSLSVNSLIAVERELWVGTKSGVWIYRLEDDSLKPHLQANQLPHPNVSELHHYNGDDVLIGTDSGMSRAIEGQIQSFGPEDKVTSIYVDHVGHIWVGYLHAGIHVFGQDLQELAEISACGSSITALYQHVDELMYVGTLQKGLCLYNPKQPGTATFRLPAQTIRDITSDFEGHLWVATDGDGLFRYFGDDKQQYRKLSLSLYSLGSNQIYDLMINDRGDLMVALFPAGLQVFDHSLASFRHYFNEPGNENSLSNDAITTLHKEEEQLYIGTENGLNVMNLGDQRIERLRLPEQQDGMRYPILDIERQGEWLWIGTWSHGLYSYQASTRTWRHYGEAQGLQDNFIWALHVDAQNRLWLGTENAGLAYFDPQCQCFHHFQANNQPGSLSFNFVRAILEDRKGRLWIATRNGLNLFNRQTESFSQYPPEGYQLADPGTRYTSLYEDRLGRLWMGTEDGGLSVLDGKTYVLKTLSKEAGMPSTAVSGITEDADGNLWVATLSGLARVDKRFTAVDIFDVRSGLSSDFFNRNAIVTTHNAVYAGSASGLNKIELHSINTADRYVPNLFITSLEVNHSPYAQFFNKWLGEDQAPPRLGPLLRGSKEHSKQPIELQSRWNTLSFEFSVLNFRPSDHYSYRYRLVNQHNDWVSTRSPRAVYNNLDGGNYIFEVMGTSRHGKQTSIKQFSFTVLPPFYASTQAFLLYIIVAALLLLALGIHYKKRIELSNQKRMNHKLQKLDKIKDLFLANTSHELRTPLAGIVNLAENVSEMVEESKAKAQLKLIVSVGKRLNLLVNDILDFSKYQSDKITLNRENLALSNLINHTFEVLGYLSESNRIKLINEVPSNTLVFADKNRLEQILVNCLSNGIKFSKEGYVRVSFRKNDGKDIILIEDTGIGMPQEKLKHLFIPFKQLEDNPRFMSGTGLGLSITKMLVEAHDGDIKISSKVDVGTTVSIALPTSNYGSLSAEFNIAQQPLGHNRAISIALIDDDPVSRYYLLYTLEKEKLQVMDFPSAEPFMEKLDEGYAPDLVILDLFMPTMSGLVMKHMIEAKDRRLNYLFITSIKPTQELAWECGVDLADILQKPINRQCLIARIELLLNDKKH